jgi:hypothetical protein
LPTWVCQATLPSFAFSATSLPSSWPMYTRPPYTATPRLTGPQQNTVCPS